MIIIAIAAAAAIASPVGGAIAMVTRPNSLFVSITVGFAGGVLLGTFGFEMIPSAVEKAKLGLTLLGFVTGLGLTYAFDLFVHRGAIVGDKADQREEVERQRRRKPPRGNEITVLAGGTSAEEMIEGITIGVSAAVDPGLAMVVGASIVIDNVSEALSIGELARETKPDGYRWTILKWTGLIGISLFVSAMIGWLGLRHLPDPALGLLLAIGAGGMFYLTVSDLVPEAQSHQYEGSAALAIAAGFMVALVISEIR